MERPVSEPSCVSCAPGITQSAMCHGGGVRSNTTLTQHWVPSMVGIAAWNPHVWASCVCSHLWTSVSGTQRIWAEVQLRKVAVTATTVQVANGSSGVCSCMEVVGPLYCAALDYPNCVFGVVGSGKLTPTCWRGSPGQCRVLSPWTRRWLFQALLLNSSKTHKQLW